MRVELYARAAEELYCRLGAWHINERRDFGQPLTKLEKWRQGLTCNTGRTVFVTIIDYNFSVLVGLVDTSSKTGTYVFLQP